MCEFRVFKDKQAELEEIEGMNFAAAYAMGSLDAARNVSDAMQNLVDEINGEVVSGSSMLQEYLETLQEAPEVVEEVDEGKTGIFYPEY